MLLWYFYERKDKNNICKWRYQQAHGLLINVSVTLVALRKMYS